MRDLLLLQAQYDHISDLEAYAEEGIAKFDPKQQRIEILTKMISDPDLDYDSRVNAKAVLRDYVSGELD